MNTWMNNPQYLAQVGRFFGAYSMVITVALLFGDWQAVAIAIGIGAAAAALKEFWYDMRYELPKQTWKDSLMDFAFYLVGMIVASGVAAASSRLR